MSNKPFTDIDLKLSVQQQIYVFILTHPGIHFRELGRRLPININTLRYHLDFLERKGIFSIINEGNLKAYYVAAKVDVRDKKTLFILQQKRFRDILMTLFLDAPLLHKEIYQRLNLHPTTLTKYLKILQELKVVVGEYVDNKKKYRVANEAQILNLLLSYRTTFWDRLVDQVLKIYFE